MLPGLQTGSGGEVMKRLSLAICLAGIWLAWTTLAVAGNVYLISGGDATQDNTIHTVLESFGHFVTVGVTPQNFDGTQSLSSYNAVILLNSSNFSLGDMPVAGQIALSNFVMAGHGLITGEWFLFNTARAWFDLLFPMSPAWYDDAYNHTTPITYTAQDPDPVLNFNVISPLTFNVTSFGGTESKLVRKTGAKTYYRSSNLEAGIAGWRYGLGRVLNFSTPIGPAELVDDDYKRLLSNAVTWVSTAVPPAATRIYVFSGGNLTQDLRIKEILEGLGHQVDLGVKFYQFDGTLNLTAYKVLILLASTDFDIADMPLAGQNALLNLISSGRRLITGEWTIYTTSKNNYLQTLMTAFPADSDGTYSSTSPITYMAKHPDPVLNFNVPSSFSFAVTNLSGTEARIWTKSGAQTFYDSLNLDAGLVGWKYGAGSVLNFSTPMGPAELDNSNYRQLLINAISWTGPRSTVSPMIYLLLN
jgi:hypothetical protein